MAGLRAFVVVVLICTCVQSRSAEEAGQIALAIPLDASLMTAGYLDLGVPEPSREWSAREFGSVLRILRRLGRNKLPRHGSSKSGPIFERLLITHSNWPDLVSDASFNNKTQKRDNEFPVSPLPGIYEISARDRLLFDRELLEIRAAIVERSLGMLETREALERKVKEISWQLVPGISGPEWQSRAHQIRGYEKLMKDSSAALQEQLSALLNLASLPEIDAKTRKILGEKVESFAQPSSKILSEGDRAWITALLKAVAQLEFNEPIRVGLLDAAAVMGSAKPRVN
jgi:hypothetical protein